MQGVGIKHAVKLVLYMIIFMLSFENNNSHLSNALLQSKMLITGLIPSHSMCCTTPATTQVQGVVVNVLALYLN